MRRRLVRPFGSTISPSRGFSLVMLLVIVWVMYDRSRDPAVWQWLAPGSEEPPATAAAPAAPAEAVPETVVAGPTDLDERSAEEMKTHLRFVSDRSPLRTREMPAYWQMMGWSRAQPLAEFEQRAAEEPTFSQLWEKPGDYRGKPIRLKLHIRRVLHYPAPENPLGLKDVYEVWGWTEGSKSFPYVVVVPELPPGINIGTEVEGEGIFTGYFLKIMAYTAFDVNRGAPLFVGRMRAGRISTAPRAAAGDISLSTVLSLLAGLAAVAVVVLGWRTLRPKRKLATALPDDLSFDPAATNPGDGSTPPAGGEDWMTFGQTEKQPPDLAVASEPEKAD